jgi:hypothetical protein
MSISVEKFQLNYPEDELKYLKKNNDLLQDWKNNISNGDIINGYTPESFVFDGFYPYYYSRKIKILFIALECVGLDGNNYIEELFKAYKNNCIGKNSINRYKFHYLMFYLAYGINNNFPDWEKIPSASTLTKNFGTNDGISFAFMELSKFSNDSGSSKKNIPLINNFIDISKSLHGNINYWNEQIKILDPNLIITMNFNDNLEHLGIINNMKYSDNISEYTLRVGDKNILLLDAFHFAARNKSDKNIFYDPIKNILSEKYYKDNKIIIPNP